MASITPSYDREGEHIGWQVAVRKKGYPPQYKTFRTRKEGEAWASVTESEMVRGVWRDRSEAESTTLKECLDRYLAECAFRRSWAVIPLIVGTPEKRTFWSPSFYAQVVTMGQVLEFRECYDDDAVTPPSVPVGGHFAATGPVPHQPRWALPSIRANDPPGVG